jgi:dTMP kinase
MGGIFITFEGGEGSGKSTQIRLLANLISGQGKNVVLTREPGGTPEAEALRNLLVTGKTNRWSPEAEALLNYAARDSHLQKVIRPALTAGKVVLCDRFMDSTRAYQGFAGNCSMELLDTLEATIVADTLPNLTLIFDLDPAEGLARAKSRGLDGEDRYERKGLDFHKRLRDGFLQIARAEPTRCRVIDAHGTVELVATRVASVLGHLLNG